MNAPDLQTVVRVPLPASVESVATRVIGCAIEAHRGLGPGLVERVYESALLYELRSAGLRADQQIEITIPYKSIHIGGQRLDLLVEGCVLIELKAVSLLNDVHLAQTLSYLRAARLPLGLLINFHAPILKDGLRRVINDRWSATSALKTPTSRP